LVDERLSGRLATLGMCRAWVSCWPLAWSLGRRMVARHLNRAPVRAVDERLTRGGWLAVASLRLIPVVPFLPTNYACGLSSGWLVCRSPRRWSRSCCLLDSLVLGVT
jgi:hypothetical protein